VRSAHHAGDVAIDAGLYVGVFTPRRDIGFEPKLDATVIPWSAVKGTQVSITGFVGDDIALTVKIDDPAFERSTDRDRDLQPRAALGRTCLQRQGKPEG
jgi:hypothetical protein